MLQGNHERRARRVPAAWDGHYTSPTSDVFPQQADPMSHRIAALYERVVLRHPWLALALLGFVMAALLPGLRNFKLDASTDALLLESDKDLRSFRQLAMRYQTRDFLFVAVVPKDGDVFTPATLGMISDVRDELTQVAAVKDIITVLDVPLLFETNGHHRMDAVVVVSAPADLQRQRVLARENMTAEKLDAILARQMPDEEKRQRADFVVDTSQGIEPVRARVRDILAEVAKMPRRRS